MFRKNAFSPYMVAWNCLSLVAQSLLRCLRPRISKETCSSTHLCSARDWKMRSHFPKSIPSSLGITLLWGPVSMFLPPTQSLHWQEGESTPVVQTHTNMHNLISQPWLLVEEGPVTPSGYWSVRRGIDCCLLVKIILGKLLLSYLDTHSHCRDHGGQIVSGWIRFCEGQDEERGNKQILDDMVRPLNQTSPEAQLYLTSHYTRPISFLFCLGQCKLGFEWLWIKHSLLMQ